ncbi:MAG TPA: DUF5916 domain-containing protein [Candidatus Baltobacteraceae bacterium]|nr:DUF5916 domain-containing protein [Candidatus Baltobacteraceae bacterium]
MAQAPKIDGTLDDAAWQNAARVQLDWDFTYRRRAEDRTDVYLLMDRRFLYVAFVAQQDASVTASQHTDNVPLTTDDVVRVYLWPGGDQGFEYGFESNPIGTHYQFSSENTAFAPAWVSAGKVSGRGYIVTERIPLDVMRNDRRTTWRLQFDRTIQKTNSAYEWSHAESQLATDQAIYTGYLTGMDIAVANTRTKPRVQPYVLAQAGTSGAGGSTSRMGADFAIPITATASFVGTLHPDYSNVELDQQTIAPTAFPRFFQEVRPFFTQGSHFFNNFQCNDCIDGPKLYTPSIPTPRDGFAVEGVQGPVTFAAFDAMSAGRSDSAQNANFSTPDRRYSLIVQRETVDMPGVHDDTTYYQAQAGNGHNFYAYATGGGEGGTYITQPGGGVFREYGLGLYTPKSGIFASYHDVGPQFAPLDGFNAFNDVQGPAVFAQREFDFGQKAFIQNVTVSQDYNRYHSHAGGLDFSLDSSSLVINTRTLFTISLTSGENYILQSGAPGGLANQNGVSIAYAQNTSTPTTFSYNVGRFGGGYLRSTVRSTSLRLGRRQTLSVEADNTDWNLDTGATEVQWLERTNFAYQISANSSFAIGARRILGTGPAFFGKPQFVDASNVSLAYYNRIGPGELYLVYGNPNALYTQPALIVKWILYLGAQKGT